MASFKLTPNVLDNLRREVQRLVELRVGAVEQYPFPLSREQVIAATMPKAALECFRVLQSLGETGRMQTATLHMIVPAGTFGADDTATTWTTLLAIALQDQTHYVWDMQIHKYLAVRAFDDYIDHFERASINCQRLLLRTDTLDPKAISALVKWVNLVARERRIATTTVKLVSEFLSKYCASTGELYRRWPGLRVLFDKLPSPWPERMRDVKSLRAGPSRWGWPGFGPAREWYEENYDRMASIEAVLVGCQTFDNTAPSLPSTLAVRAHIAKVEP